MHDPQSCFLFPCHAFLLDLWIETLRGSFPGQLLISTVVPSFPSHRRKDRRISLRIGTIYKINIKAGLHFAQVTSHENSSSCIFVEHPPPVSINCTLPSRIKYSPPETLLQGVAACLWASNDLRFQLLLSKSLSNWNQLFKTSLNVI